MPIAYTRRKIHHLRQQPEHVRLRAATLMTIASGVVLVGLWAGILLPLQLHFSRHDDRKAGQVSGAQDQAVVTSPTPTPWPTYLPTTQP